ncbi:MAG: alkaline phosphatase D family protein [Lentisphaeraceae bacterium]|nr:alkaline phosphatase D family protein [Lentisphaeraceae bacterium]
MDFSKLDDFARYESGISRRLFLSYTAALSALPWLGVGCASFRHDEKFETTPFTLGVASGDPDHEGMVLWTKLAPKPLQIDYGMPLDSYAEVKWEIATDEAFKNIVQSGSEVANPQLGHTVHVETEGLDSDSWYWYRFHCGDYTSSVGRTRTMPLPSASPDKLKFAVTSCQNYEQGLFSGYDQMIADDVDFVVHLGDYIYEYAGKENQVRKHIGTEIENLAQYRQRYAQYRSDPLLQKIHSHCPWLVTWDDHEFDNNCAGDISEKKGVDKVLYLQRRAAAYQAYYEMMPLRKRSVPSGPDMQLYRQVNFGQLANFYILDTRQYRTDQPNGDGKKPLNDKALDPKNSLLGKNQKSWMYKSLLGSQAKWNVLAQQVMMGTVNTQRKKGKGAVYSMDQWSGYIAERNDIMRFMSDRNIDNPVVLTGDIHCNWANELRVDDLKNEEKIVASEFVVTSLTSGGNRSQGTSTANIYKANNAGVKFYNEERGYILCELSSDKWVSHYKTTNDVLKPGGKTSIRSSYMVNAGNPKVYKA